MDRNRIRTALKGLFVSAAFMAGPVAPATEGQSDELPALQTVGTFGFWTLFCNQSPSVASDCALAQAVQSQTSADIKLAVSISFDDSGDPRLKMRVEPVPLQTEGVALLVDGTQTGVVVPSACDGVGCTATFVPPTTMMAQILRGKELAAEFRMQSSAKGGSSISLDLPGVADGLVAMSKRVKPTGGDGWIVSSADFKVDLVNLKDLPKDKIVQIGDFSRAISIASGLIECNTGGIPFGEHRPQTVRISVNSRMELVNYTDKSDSGLKQLADVTQRCGDEYFVSMIADSKEPSPDYSKALFQIQEAAVENVLANHGISRNRLLVADYRAGLLVSQSSNAFIGEWSFSGAAQQGRR